jgi:acyl carrier protein phosphodiesterase
MNYLAHAYLSFGHPDILVGNMISDYVKGRKKDDYPDAIRKGISLHRAIDAFTDTHAAVADAKTVFRKDYRLYSGAFVDIAFDHFLAVDPEEFSDGTLKNFAEKTYGLLEPYAPLFPDPFSRMFPYMRTQNWLYNYQFHQGVENSFGGLVRRAKYITESDTAFHLFERNYELLRSCYDRFFPDLKEYAYLFYLEARP